MLKSNTCGSHRTVRGVVNLDNPAMKQLMRADSMAPYRGHFLHSPQTPRLAPWVPPPGGQRSK